MKVTACYFYALQTRETDPYYSADHFGIVVHVDCSHKPVYAEIKRTLKR